MKKTFLLSMLLTLTVNLIAQEYAYLNTYNNGLGYYSTKFSNHQYKYTWFKDLEKVKEAKWTTINHKGDTFVGVIKFDLNENQIYAANNKKGEMKPYSQNFYTGDLLDSAYTYSYRRRKKVGTSVYTYNKDSLISSFIYINKKSDTSSILVNMWIEGQKCLSKTYSYDVKKEGRVLNKRWEYTYYGDCEKKDSKLFNKKGKLVKTWTYACKQEGEELTVEKKEKKICKYEEVDNQYLIKVSETFNEKGEVRKQIQKFSLKDTTLLENTWMNEDGVIYYHETRNMKGKLLSIEYYKNNGKLRSKRIYKYDADKLIENTYFYNPTKTSKRIYKYNSEGDRTEEVYYFKNKLRSKSEYNYNSENKLISKKSYGKEGKFLSETTMEATFYP